MNVMYLISHIFLWNINECLFTTRYN